jgi:hypothetical protein
MFLIIQLCVNFNLIFNEIFSFGFLVFGLDLKSQLADLIEMNYSPGRKRMLTKYSEN